MSARFLELVGVYARAADRRPAGEIDQDVREELAHHLALLADELVAGGMEQAEAEREARRRFGDLDRARRACMDIELVERNVMNRLHVVLTAALAAAVVWLLLENVRERERAAIAMHEFIALREGQPDDGPPAPAEIVLQVGDYVEIIDLLGVVPHVHEQVALDGKLLVPDVGWVGVAGLTRAEAEATVNNACQPFYTQANVRLRVTR